MAILRITSELCGYEVQATDANLGEVHDFCFDQKSWDVQYLVVDVARWFWSRMTFIPISVLRQPDWEAHIFSIGLPRKEIDRNLSTDLSKLLHSQGKGGLPDDWPLYWGGGRLLIAGLFDQKKTKEESAVEKDADCPYLWRLKELQGYRIQANDGEIGQVIDFIVDCKTWSIQHIIVKTLDSPSGKKVLVETQLTKDIDFSSSRLITDLTQEAIMDCPEFDYSNFAEKGSKRKNKA